MEKKMWHDYMPSLKGLRELMLYYSWLMTPYQILLFMSCLFPRELGVIWVSYDLKKLQKLFLQEKLPEGFFDDGLLFYLNRDCFHFHSLLFNVIARLTFTSIFSFSGAHHRLTCNTLILAVYLLLIFQLSLWS